MTQVCEHGMEFPHVLHAQGVVCVPGLRAAFRETQDVANNLRARYEWLLRSRHVGNMAFRDKRFEELTDEERARLLEWPA